MRPFFSLSSVCEISWNYVFVCSTNGSEGTGLSWYGTTPTEFSHQETTATYSIDGGSPVTFSVPGLRNANSSTQYNRKLFEIPILSAGPHNLTVALTQGGNMSPLTLDYLTIDGGSTAYLGTGSSASSGGLNSASTLSVSHFLRSMQERQPQPRLVSTRRAPLKVPLQLVLLLAAF